MNSSLATNLMLATSMSSVCKCLYLRKGVCLSKFQSKALEGKFVGYGLKSHTYRIFDVLSRVIVETCSVEFDENNGSQVAQFHVCDADDEGPEVSIQKMGVGFFRPTELHQDTTQEETSSTPKLNLQHHKTILHHLQILMMSLT